MKTCRCNFRPVRLVFLVCQLGLILMTEAQIPEICNGQGTNRPPKDTDITAICGTEYMDLSIFLCPVYQALYNESFMVLSTTNLSVTIIDQVGSGLFSNISEVLYVNISGSVTSIDPSAGIITYQSQILYKFSCLYPMQYFSNNTKLSVFNVFLDRFYATANPYPKFQPSHDLFVGCTRDAQTKVELNGASQEAHFSFEAFTFVEHKYQIISTFYLHCITRLCEVSSCRRLMPEREAQYVSDTSAYYQTEKGNKYKAESPPHSVFDGNSTSFLGCSRINVLAAIVCNVILTTRFSD